MFHITNAVTTVISGLTITNGRIISATLPYPGNSAGGIYNDHSTLTLSNCILSGNAANGSGGGIVNNGESGSATLTVSNCTFSGNTGGNGGGGILNDGTEGHVTMRVIASTFTGNSGGSTSLGGGIYNTSFAGTNTSTVIASTFVGNTAGYGGGIYNDRSTLTLSNCVFSDNSAITSSGGDGGGGIVNYFGKLTVVATTLSGNSAAQFGGGIFNDCPSTGLTGIVTLTACTLSGNSATINGGGDIYNSGVFGSAMLNLGDTILNGGASASNIVNFGSITSLGYNLSSDNGAGALSNTGNQINTDPMLGPLANNGGPTLTCAPQPGSPPIDRGKSFGLTADQRGFPRLVDDPCLTNAVGGDGSDIGAVETQNTCINLQITAITRETNDILITWTTYAGKTNALQATAGAGDGSYQTNSFANLFIVTNTIGTTTSFLDVGGATNKPARYYRVRLVP